MSEAGVKLGSRQPVPRRRESPPPCKALLHGLFFIFFYICLEWRTLAAHGAHPPVQVHVQVTLQVTLGSDVTPPTPNRIQTSPSPDKYRLNTSQKIKLAAKIGPCAFWVPFGGRATLRDVFVCGRVGPGVRFAFQFLTLVSSWAQWVTAPGGGRAGVDPALLFVFLWARRVVVLAARRSVVFGDP